MPQNSNDGAAEPGRQSRRPLVSVMIPCLNEEETLTHVAQGLIDTLAADREFAYELVFIDDHSDDHTPQILSDLCQQHANVRAIRLGRNCGSHLAYRAGLEICTGDAVAFAVADLQEGPDLIRQALQLWRTGTQVVGTVANGRDRGGFLNEVGARVFYWLRYRLGRSTSREAAQAALRVIDRQVVEHCLRFAPRINNLNSWVFAQPFEPQFLSYTPTPRKYGKSRWTFRKKLRLVVDTLLDESPFFLTCWLGLGGLLLAGGLTTLVAGLAKLLWDGTANADIVWPTLFGSLATCTGLILVAAGTVGVYLWRVYQELRGGPGYSYRALDGGTITPDVRKEAVQAVTRRG